MTFDRDETLHSVPVPLGPAAGNGGQPTADELRKRCEAHIVDHDIAEIVNRTHYALVRSPS